MRLGNNVNGRHVLTEDEKRMQDRLTHVRKTCESYDEWKGKLGTFGTKTQIPSQRGTSPKALRGFNICHIFVQSRTLFHIIMHYVIL